MQDEDDLPNFHYKILPINLYPWEKGLPPDAENEREALRDVSEQLIKYMTEALKHKDDPWRAIKIIAKAERIVSDYVQEDFCSFEPLQAGLQRTLRLTFRMARRAFIRSCFKHGMDPTTEGARFHDDTWDEDFVAVERHLAEGRRLNEGLWVSRKERAKYADLGLEGLIKFLNARAGFVKYTLANVRAGLDNDEEALQWLGHEAVGQGNA
jgi:hypothetical protein